MKFLTQSDSNSLYFLFLTLIERITENGITISFSNKELEKSELILIFNIDIKKDFLRCLKEILIELENYDSSISQIINEEKISDILIFYKNKNEEKVVIIELGFHKMKEYNEKFENTVNLLKKMNLYIKNPKFFAVKKHNHGGSHHKKEKNIKIIRFKNNTDFLEHIRKV